MLRSRQNRMKSIMILMILQSMLFFSQLTPSDAGLWNRLTCMGTHLYTVEIENRFKSPITDLQYHENEHTEFLIGGGEGQPVKQHATMNPGQISTYSYCGKYFEDDVTTVTFHVGNKLYGFHAIKYVYDCYKQQETCRWRLHPAHPYRYAISKKRFVEQAYLG